MKTIYYYWFVVVLTLPTLRLTEPAIFCEKKLLANSIITATSQASSIRGANESRLHGDSAWMAKEGNYHQYLDIILARRHVVTSVATRGQDSTGQHVSKYAVQYSDDGDSFRTYMTPQGVDQLFQGNKDGDSIHRNYFKRPIITQWFRFNPIQWHGRIAMRVELYGCEYRAKGLRFDGSSFIHENLQIHGIQSNRDYIRLRFRTSSADGIMMYSSGTRGDLFSLQLTGGQLLLNIDLGSRLITSVSAGSSLDDNFWHDVLITRNRVNLTMMVDHVLAKRRIRGDLLSLDLDRELFIGGIPNFNVEGLVVSENFTGCIENLFINHSNVIAELKRPPPQKYKAIGVLKQCEDSLPTVPVSFKTEDVFLKLKNYEVKTTMTVSIEFRTFYKNGLLVFHKFLEGSVQLILLEGKLKLVGHGENSSIYITHDDIVNDGYWHNVKFTLGLNSGELFVNDEIGISWKVSTFKTGPQYIVAGGVTTIPGFVGCIRNIRIDDEVVNVMEMTSSNDESLAIGSCQIVDKCNPNPCENDGFCEQTWETFHCKCAKDYGGAVCHTSIHPLSCEDYHRSNPLHNTFVPIEIDLDGSGHVEPFPVICEFSDEIPIKTYLSHKNVKETIVVIGVQKPENLVQDITYDSELPQIIELLKRSITCKQHIAYEYSATNLNATGSETGKIGPLFWWMSRSNEEIDFWNGTTAASRKCYCRNENRHSEYYKLCDCDFNVDKWEGVIEKKSYLPVHQLHFGTANTSMDQKRTHYTLGKLVCEGDHLFQHAITFTTRGSFFEIPRFDLGYSTDIYFQLKTTVKDAVLIHSIGPTDYIRLAIQDGKMMKLSWVAGNGNPNVITVAVNSLNDNQWHSVLVEINRKEVRLLVDDSFEQVNETDGPVQAIHLTSNVVIGTSVYHDEGYIGCIRALLLNGRIIHFPDVHETDGLMKGCIGKCHSKPCLHNSICIESYEDYSCDCRNTPFRGLLCSDEVGVSLESNNRIQYLFEKSHKFLLVEKIHVGFRTVHPKGLLFGLYGQIGLLEEYFNVLMTFNGSLLISFDFGFGRQDFISSDLYLADGEMHDLRVTRSIDRLQFSVKIDQNEEKIFNINGGQTATLSGLHHLFIGRNGAMNEDDGFIGCISRVEFYDIFPIKLLFHQPKLPNIIAKPGNFSEDYCGIAPITKAPITMPPDADDAGTATEQPSTNLAVLGGILALLFIIIVIVILLCCRYTTRHKGEYNTHEDEGALDTTDADTAVLQAHTVPEVIKKREWFM